MPIRHFSLLATAAALAMLSQTASAQSAAYGEVINLEQAKKIVAAAVADSRRQNLPMAIAVVDNAGLLIAFERMDNTLTGSVPVAQDKAASAALFRRPTKAFQDAVASGGAGLRVLGLRGAVSIEGGLPIVVNDKVVGAVGVSGGTSEQDGVVAKAGLDAIQGK